MRCNTLEAKNGHEIVTKLLLLMVPCPTLLLFGTPGRERPKLCETAGSLGQGICHNRQSHND